MQGQEAHRDATYDKYDLLKEDDFKRKLKSYFDDKVVTCEKGEL